MLSVYKSFGFKKMKHPSQLELIAFYENPDHSDSHEIGLHLATCRDCRESVQKIESLMNQLKSEGFSINTDDELDHLQRQRLMDSVDGRLADNEKEKVAALIKKSTVALRYMLDYRLYKQTAGRTAANMDSESLFQRLWHKLKQVLVVNPMAGWAMVPVSMVIVYGLTTILMLSGNQQNKSFVASFQNEPYLFKTPAALKKPGVGFFNQSNTLRQAYGQVQIREEAGKLIVNWPAIDGVEHYAFSLNKGAGDNIIIEKQQLSDNIIVIDSQLLVKSVSYNWEISAITADGFRVNTRGGFVRN